MIRAGEGSLPRVSAEREQALLGLYETVWVGRLRERARAWGFERGFIERLTIEPGKLLMAADEVFGAHPVRHLRLVGGEWVLKNLLASRHLVRLLTLDLSGLTLNRPALLALTGSPHLGGLRELRLTDTGLDDEGARTLSEATGFGGLRVLDVGRNPHLTETGRTALRGRFGDETVSG